MNWIFYTKAGHRDRPFLFVHKNRSIFLYHPQLPVNYSAASCTATIGVTGMVSGIGYVYPMPAIAKLGFQGSEEIIGTVELAVTWHMSPSARRSR